jgi:hypothetical protein
MAWEGPRVNIPGLVAGDDLSDYRYCFVMLDVNVTAPPTVIPVTGTSDRPIGILQNNPREGEEAEVTVYGISKVYADENLTLGQSIGVGYPAGQDTQVGGQAAVIPAAAPDLLKVPNLGTVLLANDAQGVATVTVNCLNQER